MNLMDADRTQMGTDPSVDPNRTQMGPGPSVDPNKTIMGASPTINATVTIKPVQCPVCKSFNPPAVAFCNECGLIFDRMLEGDAFGAPAVQLPVLVDGEGSEHILRPGENVIGRQGDILIEDTRVSRRHASVEVNGESLVVRDLGSTNGTKVDGAEVPEGESMELHHGGVLSLGGCELTLTMPGEKMRTQMPSGGRTASMTIAPTVGMTQIVLRVGEEEYDLSIGTYSIGRRADNDIVIEDPYASGSHAELEVTEDGVFLTDLGSTNGSFVDSAKLDKDQKTKLEISNEVKLGHTDLRLRMRT